MLAREKPGLREAAAAAIDQRMTEKDIKNSELARLLGVERQTVGAWRSGRTFPRPENAQALADALDLPLSTLLEPSEHANVALPARRGDTTHPGAVPLINWVDAGKGAEVVVFQGRTGEFEHVSVATRVSQQAFALEVRGNSMLPDFSEGDVIVIDPAVEPVTDDYVVVELLEGNPGEGNGPATFKRYRPMGTVQGQPCFLLIPLNPEFDAITVSMRNPGRIIGTVVEHHRKLR